MTVKLKRFYMFSPDILIEDVMAIVTEKTIFHLMTPYAEKTRGERKNRNSSHLSPRKIQSIENTPI